MNKEFGSKNIIIEKKEMRLIVERLVAQIMENYPDSEDLLIVGIQRRGADLARRIVNLLEENLDKKIALGTLDINLYRDDWTSLAEGSPHIGPSSMPYSTDNKKIILVDDVLFTGRTIRSALEALLDYGRPQKVELLVFIDRGHRELPICANYIGRKINTQRDQHVDVHFEERDGKEAVCLTSK